MKRNEKKARSVEDLMADESIKNPLREWLHDRGRTLIDLSRETGISYNSLQMYALGYRPTPPEVRAEISRALGLNIDRLPMR